MSQSWTVLTSRYGDDIGDPSAAQLAEALAELYHEELPDVEHGDAWVRFGYDDGPMYVLTVNRCREVSLEEWADQDFENELVPRRTMHDVPEDQALQLWKWVAAGQIDRVRSQAWG